MSSKPAARWTRRAAILGAAALAGCGFSPAFGPNGPARGLRNAIEFQTPDTVEGYRLRERLERRLGAPEAPRYVLNVTLDLNRSDVAIASDGEAGRITLNGKARYSLSDMAGTPIASGHVDAFTGYSTNGSTVATRAGEEDARLRLANILAGLIVARLMAISANLPE